MTALPSFSSDTIVAIATAPGRAGVAVTRLSGPACQRAVRALCGQIPSPRHATRTAFCHPETGDMIDDGLVLWFPGPASFTGEDCVEFQGHGGRAVTDALVAALCCIEGVRLAEPGEFSRRAYINGKMDLTTVEGLADLIHADTDRQRRQALRQMRGDLAARLDGWRDDLIRHIAWIEAYIDFPDEDLPQEISAQIHTHIDTLAASIAGYLNDNRRGERMRDGLHVAVIGKPNVGKSSLVNALAQRDVAIVSSEAGTTRDVIEVHLDLGGFPVTVADTAGLRHTDAAVEAEGIRRARDAAAQADFKIAVFDASMDAVCDQEVASLIGASLIDASLIDERTLVVFNKCDLVAPSRIDTLTAQGHIALSLTQGQKAQGQKIQGQGISILLDRLLHRISQDFGTDDQPTLTRQRHRTALTTCHTHVVRAGQATELELMAEDMRLAARALGQITGRVHVDDFLDVIFSDFCIGK